MKHVLEELTGIQGVTGALWFDISGLLRHRTMAPHAPLADPADCEWWQPFLAALNGVKEIELAYSAGRAYIRRNAEGCLMVWTTSATPMALVRLNCDILLNERTAVGSREKRKRFFTRRF